MRAILFMHSPSILSIGILVLVLIRPVVAQSPTATDILSPTNLVAWCIVPFDASKRTPQQRARMLKELGIQRCAYDWRAEHVPTFEQEILAYKEHDIEFFAFWSVHDEAFELFQKHDLHPQIWYMMPQPAGQTQAAKVAEAAKQLEPLLKKTKAIDCKLGLYNHGGWSGEPANLAAVCQQLRQQGHGHVGIVYNFHHGHEHIADWKESLQQMLPYLFCLNVNGMNDKANPKILGLDKGEHEQSMIAQIIQSGYDGPIGILDHRSELDAKESLKENLDGMEQIRKRLKREEPKDASPDLDDQAQGTNGSTKLSATQSTIPYDPQRVSSLTSDALQHGDAARGARVFTDARFACIACHHVYETGGTVGPDLQKIAGQRTHAQWIESVIWPQREVHDNYQTWRVLSLEGNVITGYQHAEDDQELTLRDPSSGELLVIAKDDIEVKSRGGSVMPEGLINAMQRQQQLDLFRFLFELNHGDPDTQRMLADAVAAGADHTPASFPITKEPIAPARYAHWRAHVNRDRLFDFYTKQAEFFCQSSVTPMLIQPFPGLDGGQQGHWGNQNEDVWRDGRWNQAILGSVQAGVVRAGGKTIPRGICVRLGDEGEGAICFNPDTLTYELFWTGGFVGFDPVRHGFVSPLILQGELQDVPPSQTISEPYVYKGFYRYKNRVVFAYRIGDVDYLDSPWLERGEFVREVAPADEHSMRRVLSGGPSQWPQVLSTKILMGSGKPYAVDRIEVPLDNPWNVPMFFGGIDFLNDGSAMVCTMQGDVWHVSGLVDNGEVSEATTARWRRFASGLHHALGLVVAEGNVYVQCRDQLMRLTDFNGDGEADFYECINKAFVTSAAGHDYICGLQRDNAGNFYTASGNQGLLRLSPDGKQATVLASGFRNPDGLGLVPETEASHRLLTVPVSEGNWTPASMIFAIEDEDPNSAYAGYGGPRDGQPPTLPLAYLPRGIDNSSGGQTFVSSERFGPLKGQLIHLSSGAGSWFVLLRDRVGTQRQGAIIPMAGDFSSGVHRGRFNRADGQFYAAGMSGWGSYTVADGCLERVRFSGERAQIPIDFHLHENGIRITFAEAIDVGVATDVRQQFAQCWNYRYSGGYGSPEFSTTHPGVPGHDPLPIASAHALPDGRSLFLELPELQPCNQLHLRLHVNEDESLSCGPTGSGHDLFVTVHALDAPFTQFPGYQKRDKVIAAHPLLADLALSAARPENPWRKKIAGAKAMELRTAKNLTYSEKELVVNAGEPIAFSLINPDVVPHNWVLVKPDALKRVGELSNQLIAKPDAYARQYVPESEDVLYYTDITDPGQRETIYFNAPQSPGRYPFLCTFPGHWMVMNGTLIVR
ncbi:MAG: plastocyanin/azurin family copper-binding protein [Pirellulaceae bacterium]